MILAAMLLPICLIFFFLILIVGILIAAFLWKRWADKKLEELCRANGWTFYGNNVPGARNMIKGSPLDRGHSQKMFYGIGREFYGDQISTFQWQYTTGHGKHQQTHHYKVALMPLPFRERGYIYIRRESVFDKVGNVFGFNDLDFEHQEFSDKYYVRAKPEKFGYDFFHPRMIEFFMQYSAYDMVIKNSTMMLYQSGSMGGFGTVFKLKKGENPFTRWMEASSSFCVNVKKRIPKMMKRKEARVLSRYDDDNAEERVVIGQAVSSDGSMTSIECPSCSAEFKIPRGETSITCPECGLEGEL